MTIPSPAPDAPAVSVLVAFDPSTQAEPATATLTALLAQARPDLEVIAVGLHGDPLEVPGLRDLTGADDRLRCLRRDTGSAAEALAQGLAAARAGRIVILPPGVAPAPDLMATVSRALPDGDACRAVLDVLGVSGAAPDDAVRPAALLGADVLTRPPVLALTRRAIGCLDSTLDLSIPWPVLALEMAADTQRRSGAVLHRRLSTGPVPGAPQPFPAGRLRMAWDGFAARLAAEDADARAGLARARARLLATLARRQAAAGAAGAEVRLLWRAALRQQAFAALCAVWRRARRGPSAARHDQA